MASDRSRDGRQGEAGFIVVYGAMALLLLGLSIVAGMRYVGPKVTTAHQQATDAKGMRVVQKALWAYVARNYQLPCPADGRIAQGSSNDGVANCSIAGQQYGVVPWQTLGLNYVDSYDGWGHRIGYAVSSALTSGARYQNGSSGSVPTAQDSIQIKLCYASCAAASNVSYVLISYGADGYAAYNMSGKQAAAPGSINGAAWSSVNEYANSLAAAFLGSAAFQFWPYDSGKATAANLYDDIAAYETSSQICNDLNGALTASNWLYCRSTGGGGGGGTAPGSTQVATISGMSLNISGPPPGNSHKVTSYYNDAAHDISSQGNNSGYTAITYNYTVGGQACTVTYTANSDKLAFDPTNQTLGVGTGAGGGYLTSGGGTMTISMSCGTYTSYNLAFYATSAGSMQITTDAGGNNSYAIPAGTSTPASQSSLSPFSSVTLTATSGTIGLVSFSASP